MDTSAGRDFVIALLGDVNVGKQSFLERYGGTSLIVGK
jgi:GTPase SAR1 family protein